MIKDEEGSGLKLVIFMKFRFFDTHSHIQDIQFSPDRDAVIARMKEKEIGAIVAGADWQMNDDAVALLDAHENLWGTVGLHPVEGSVTPFDSERFKKLAAHKKVVGIGECGLDYFYKPKSEVFGMQRDLFRAQIEIAREFKKPLMVHIRPTKGSRTDAYEDALPILDEYPDAKGNIHFFAGTWELAQEFLKRGFTLSFTGVITFARDYDEVIKNMPLDMLMSETDCPYVAPLPYRGQRNEPVYVTEVVKKIAEIRGEDFEAVREALVANAHRVWLGA